MTREEILTWLPDTLSSKTNFGALSFEVPALKWVQGEFYAAFLKRYWDENLNKWKKRWQCRDFASAYRIMMVECWALSEEVAAGSDGVACGEIWFIPFSATPTAGHAICPVFTDQGLVYIDPQNNTLWPVTTEQLLSRYYLRF